MRAVTKAGGGKEGGRVSEVKAGKMARAAWSKNHEHAERRDRNKGTPGADPRSRRTPMTTLWQAGSFRLREWPTTLRLAVRVR